MKNLEEESRTQNMQDGSGRINYAPDTQAQVSSPTSQSKVKTKTQITLGSEQFNYTRWLYKQYGYKTPSWLRKSFVINQYRRKSLNDILHEAQLDSVFCGKSTGSSEWHDQLHLVWHDINGGSSCI